MLGQGTQKEWRLAIANQIAQIIPEMFGELCQKVMDKFYTICLVLNNCLAFVSMVYFLVYQSKNRGMCVHFYGFAVFHSL